MGADPSAWATPSGERKSIEPLAARVAPGHDQELRHFISESREHVAEDSRFGDQGSGSRRAGIALRGGASVVESPSRRRNSFSSSKGSISKGVIVASDGCRGRGSRGRTRARLRPRDELRSHRDDRRERARSRRRRHARSCRGRREEVSRRFGRADCCLAGGHRLRARRRVRVRMRGRRRARGLGRYARRKRHALPLPHVERGSSRLPSKSR